MSPRGYADEVLARLVPTFRGAADPERAPAMAAYMRDKFAFLGIATPDRRRLGRDVLAGLRPPEGEQLVEVTDRCFALPEREFHYFAVDLFCRRAPAGPPDLLDHARRLLTEHAWWDTVDALASTAVGGLVRSHPALVSTMDRWIDDEDFWMARTALLHQLRYGGDTDADRLFAYCALRAGDPEFFVRKAIGWALRTYSRIDAAAVELFVAEQGDRLSGLSRREALKTIERQRSVG